MTDKQTLKLGFIDTFDTLVAPFFIEKLEKEYNIVRDDITPDVLIFGDEVFGDRNRSYDMDKVTKVFFTGENRRAENYSCHFAMGFDHNEYMANYYRMPLYVLEMWQFEKIFHKDSLHLKTNSNKYAYMSIGNMLYDNRDFCGFVNSNPYCEKRNQFFHSLNKYRKVNSGGPLFNNIGYVIPREDGVLKKIDFLSKHRFTLCFENGSYPGYATEKIIHAYYANTIPIYWGSETIALDFNPKSMLNWHNFGNDRDFLKIISEVDSNKDTYLEILSQSPLLNVYNPVFDDERFLHWWRNRVMLHVQARKLND